MRRFTEYGGFSSESSELDCIGDAIDPIALAVRGLPEATGGVGGEIGRKS